MLFNSYIFIFVFLPITLFVFNLISKTKKTNLLISWMITASLFFYGWWNIYYLWLIIFSAIFNYSVACCLLKINKKYKSFLLIFGIAVNLGLLSYFKYYNFFLENMAFFFENQIFLETIILPLGISFFTFQQIAFLVDVYKGIKKNYKFLPYFLFVTFFPQLIAGPIVYHNQLIPQFLQKEIFGIKSKNLVIGFVIFTLGLFKKVILADNAAVYVNLIFGAAETNFNISFLDAWSGALFYTFQLYFDFSGYSDMAVGLARMFGIIIPINFYSPYKSTSIIEFWRRWHITLSSFLKNYLYFPLGGGRLGTNRKMINIMITMILGGLWHGAGWLFLLWGAIHGLFIVINHTWNIYFNLKLWFIFKWFITFLAVVFAWVPFRCESVEGLINMWSGMIGLNGFLIHESYLNIFEKQNFIKYLFKFINFEIANDNLIIDFNGIILICLLLSITLFMPNTSQFMSRFTNYNFKFKSDLFKNHTKIFFWKPNLLWSLLIAFLFCIAVLNLYGVSEFLYYQF
jgi:alginate O-acetyltransferase complex protein AlgI